jgi:protein SCO1
MTGWPSRVKTPPRGSARRVAARAAGLGLVLALLAGAALPCAAGQGAFLGEVIEPPAPAPDFTLRTADGKPFRLSDQRGNVVVLYFGYTSCPDVCPTTLAQLADVKGQLGEAAARLRVALVTVDPERDTPQRLRIYIQAFDPTFLGLTGSKQALGKVWKAYGVFAEKKRVVGSPLGYLVDHSAKTYVIDAEGRLRLAMPFGTPNDTFLHDLRTLLMR